jgi:hypothetical protein
MCGLFVYLLSYVLTCLFIYLSANIILSYKIQKKYLPKLSTYKTSSEQLLFLSDNVDYKKITISLNMNNKKGSPRKKKG